MAVGSTWRWFCRKERLDLIRLEAELIDAQAAHFVARHQQRQIGQGQQGARRHKQVAVFAHHLQQAADELVDRAAFIHQVVIIQHKNKMFGDIFVNVVRDGRHQQVDIEAVLPVGAQDAQTAPAQTGGNAPARPR